ncbi:MAG: divalent-cation tolerance protein CutA [Pseudomonadota bacterium]
MSDALVVFCTCADRKTAEHIAHSVVAAELASCVNEVSGIRSHYRWEGKITTDEEILLIIKTTRASYPRLEKTILAAHPYELPEVVAVPIECGLEGYLRWIEDNTSP